MMVEPNRRKQRLLLISLLVGVLSAPPEDLAAQQDRIDTNTLESVVDTFNRVAGVLAAAQFRHGNLDHAQLLEALQHSCRSYQRAAVRRVIDHIEKHARSRMSTHVAYVRQTARIGARFADFLEKEEAILVRAGFTGESRELLLLFMLAHRRNIALNPGGWLADNQTNRLNGSIERLCSGASDSLNRGDDLRERTASLGWGLSKLLGGVGLAGANFLSGIASPLATASISFGSLIAYGGFTEVEDWFRAE